MVKRLLRELKLTGETDVEREASDILAALERSGGG